MTHLLTPYLPRWLTGRLATAGIEPACAWDTQAVVLFADLAGFTALTEAMQQGGPQGVEELGQALGATYGELVEAVYAYGGDVVKFAGDAMTAIWPADSGEQFAYLAGQAAVAAQAIQAIIGKIGQFKSPSGRVSLEMRVGISCGALTLMIVGAADQQQFLVSGPALTQAAEMEKQAEPGQIVLHRNVTRLLGKTASRRDRGVLRALHQPAQPTRPPKLPRVPVERMMPFVHPALVERLESEGRAFLADFRHDVVPIFVSFDAGGLESLQAYFLKALAVVGKHGGYLSDVEISDKGNVLIILFGVPLSSGDNSARAVDCALDLAVLPGTRGIGATNGVLFTCVVGSAKRHQFAAFGDEMNLAARLMQIAANTPMPEPADRSGALDPRLAPILVGGRVGARAGERFLYGNDQLLQVKGKAQPVRAQLVAGRSPQWSNRISPWLNKSRVVGRVEELTCLDEQIESALLGRGKLLFITGEAGVGKSCLAGELVRRWLARGGEAYVGAALASTQYSPYHAWGELLRSFFDLRNDSDDLSRLEDALASPGLGLRLPLLADVLGMSIPDNDLTLHFDTQLRQQSTQALVVELLRQRAAARPLLILLEDAHWFDQLSWEMALTLGRALADRPLLLCLASRPIDAPQPPACAALTGLEHQVTLSLSELSQDEALSLACDRLGVGSLPPELGHILQKAQGHPFFVEEMVKELRERGALLVDAGQVVVASPLEQVDLPDTVQGVVQARLDRLDERTRLTLKVASVLGRTFPFRLLYDIHPLRPGLLTLSAQLEMLQKLDITPLENTDPDLVYRFKHAIIQEVAYQSLAFAQRCQIHRSIAAWYEKNLGETNADYTILAHHCHYAGDRRGERRYARLAGERAAAQFANQEAVRYLSRALELTRSRSERYTLLLQRCKVYSLLGDREQEQRDLVMLRSLAARLGDPARRAETALAVAAYADATGDYPGVVCAAQEVIRWAREASDELRQVQGFNWWGQALWQQTQYAEAREKLETSYRLAQANTSADPSRARQVGTDSLRILGMICSEQGDYPAALAYFQDALQVYRQAGDRRNEGMVLNSIGLVWNAQGDYEQARQCFKEALHVAREIGSRRDETRLLNNLGIMHLYQNQYTEARAYYLQASQRAQEIGDRRLEALAFNNLGLTDAILEGAAAAQRSYQRAQRIAHEIGDRRTEALALNNLALLAMDQGEVSDARGYFEQALAINQEIGNRAGECLVIYNLGLTFLNAGCMTEARPHFEQALQIGREIGDRRMQAYALSDLGEILAAEGEWAPAAAAYQEALDIRRALGQTILIMETLAGFARVLVLSGEQSAAQTACDEILRCMADSSPNGMNDPYRFYLNCYDVLCGLQDERARQELEKGYRSLQEKLASMDVAARDGFLESNTAARKLIEAWEKGI
ncbi:MAG: tetratricopeptide repeat protein [Anaerolineales bacterium]|nr:tetratricopeptide repeat protein [Anaerolineales bacterium]